jgi:hypothetical protein
MTGRTRKDIVKHVAESWFDLFGQHGRPTPKTQFVMLDSLREKHQDIDRFIEIANDDDLVSAMLAVHEFYDGMERAQKMVEKEYAL